MIRIADQVVANWGLFVWEQDGKLIEQVQVYLFNGMVLILDLDDFFGISDDEAW
jgi:hypothetical protein